jgi:hypothetical protein
MPVAGAGEDLTTVVLTTSKGGTASGRVAFEDGAKPPSLTSIRVSAQPVEIDLPLMGGGAAGAVKADGAFELKGVTGHRLFRVMNPPPGWTLKSVKLNGVDVTDTGVDFKAGEAIAGLEVTLTAKSTVVTGSVTGTDGAPLKDYTVVIFSEDSDLWRLPFTRWVTGTRPDQDGRFKVLNLPAGTFYAVAVDYIAQGEWGDPELLERLRSKGKRFIVDEGGTQTLDLKLSEAY